ncbi:MAG: glycosyltransferase family 2 protein [Gemmatimonadetes bacterium]|nr:glycosyltransferase family 2 protein [Gemmatimonadota bacterium]
MKPQDTRLLISVVVPTRDRPDLLRRCLDRLAPGAQTLDAARYEVVVSDDGAPGSAATALAATHPWARTVEGPRRGPAANRNAGAKAARGEWLAFTDDDTVPSPAWLASFVAALAPGADVYEGRTTCEGGFGSPLWHAPVNETGGKLWSCNFLVRAATFERVGGFDERFRHPHMEDQDLRIRLASLGPIRFVRDAVVDHPPRRQSSGARLGAYRESEVRFMYKHGAPRPVAAALLRTIVRYRLGVIRSTPRSLDTIGAFWSLARELAYVRGHVASWERASAAEFPPPSGGA